MKKILISFAIMFTATVAIAFTQSSFPDVNPGDWFHQYVMQIKDWGIVNGDDDGYFNPGNNINRAEFSKMMVLYDERVDEKIEEATADLSVVEQPANNSVSLPSMMYLTSDRNNPADCPTGWTEANYGVSSSVGGKNNFTRTCYINKSCSVMYLVNSGKEPSERPSGLNEAGLDTSWGGNNKADYERVCYVCA